MTMQKTKTERDALDMREAGYGLEETAHRTGMTLSEVRALWERDDEEEDAELNAICDERQGENPIEADIDSI